MLRVLIHTQRSNNGWYDENTGEMLLFVVYYLLDVHLVVWAMFDLTKPRLEHNTPVDSVDRVVYPDIMYTRQYSRVVSAASRFILPTLYSIVYIHLHTYISIYIFAHQHSSTPVYINICI